MKLKYSHSVFLFNLCQLQIRESRHAARTTLTVPSHHRCDIAVKVIDCVICSLLLIDGVMFGNALLKSVEFEKIWWNSFDIQIIQNNVSCCVFRAPLDACTKI